MLLFKLIIWTLDLVLLPFHFILQQPWKKLRRMNANRLCVERLNSSEVKLALDKNFKYKTCKIKKIDDHIETFDELFKSTALKLRDRPLFGSRKKLSKIIPDARESSVTVKYTFENVYQWESYSQVNDRVEVISRKLMRTCEVNKGDNVMICSESRPDWMIVALSIFRAGAKLVPIASNSDINTAMYCIRQTQPKVLVASQPLLEKILRVLSLMEQDMISIKHIIFFEDPFAKNELPTFMGPVEHVWPFSQLEHSSDVVNETSSPPVSKASKEDVIAIFCTSGTGGDPKGVYITNQCFIEGVKNGVFVGEKLFNSIDGETFNAVHASLLPLYHIAEFGFTLLCVSYGIAIGHSSPFTFLDSSPMIQEGQLGDFKVLRPTISGVVPLLLSRIKNRLDIEMKKKGPVFSAFFDFCYVYKKAWKAKGYQTPFLDRILFGKFNAALGGRITTLTVGGALPCLDVSMFISVVFNINVVSGFGSTETLGAVTLQDAFIFGCEKGIGEPNSQNIIAKLVTWDEGGYSVLDQQGPAGELHIHSKALSVGYLMATEEESPFYTDEAGMRWYKTGDIGQVRMGANSSRRVLEIVDRKSQLVKMKNGKFVSLCALEDVMTSLPFVDMVMAHVDISKNYPVALIVPNAEELRKLGHELNLLGRPEIKDLCSNESIKSKILNSIEAAFMTNHFQPYEIPRRVLLVADTWTPETGLLTGALKLRRKKIFQAYQNEINALFL